MHTSTRIPACYHYKTKDATKDAPEQHHFEARYLGGNVVFAKDCDKDDCADLARKVVTNPSAYGF